MFTKSVLIGLVALLAIQGITAAPTDGNDVIPEIIEKLIEKLREDVKNAEIAVESFFDKLEEYADNLYEEIKEQVQKLIENALEEIGKIIEGTGQEDLDECLQDQETLMQSQTTKNLENLKECIASNVARARDIVDETVFTIENFIGFVTEDLEELSKCDDVDCHEKLMIKVLWQLIRIPKRLLDISTHTLKTILSIEKDILVCTADTVLVCGNQLNAIIADIKTCIDKKNNDV